MALRVLLIQPSIRAVLGKKKLHGSIMPPLGLISLTSVVRESCPDTSVIVTDYEVNGSNVPRFQDFDIIGFSGTSVHVPHLARLARSAREANPDVCIVAGGSHATFAYEHLLKSVTELDAVFIGESERTFVDFIIHYRKRNDLPTIRGVISRSGRVDPAMPDAIDLDTLPVPAYDALDLRHYKLSTHRSDLPVPFTALMTSRGCPYRCHYCQTPQMFGNRIRYRSVEKVNQDMLFLRGLNGVKGIVFWDDTFTADRERTKNMCNMLKSHGMLWMCNTRVECVDHDLLCRMRDAGCVTIFFGVESSHSDTLNLLNRKTDLDVVEHAFELTKSVGIKTVATIMIGAPGDDFQRIEANVGFVKSLSSDHVYISIYNVTPGAADFERARRMGLIREEIDWTNPKEFFGPPFGLPTPNERLSRSELQSAQQFAYKTFYGFDRGNEYE